MNRAARRRQAKQASARQGREAEAPLASAVRHHQAGELQQAEVFYRQVLAVQPNNPDALHLLGVIASQFGRHDAAIDLIRHALASRPDYAKAHSNLGVALNALGRLDEAVASFRRALDLEPNSVELQVNLGAALKEMGRLDEALTALRRALEIDPDNVKAHVNLGGTFNDLGRHADALGHYDQALTHSPEDADLLCNRALPLLAQGRLEEGWRAYEHRLGKREVQRPPIDVPAWDGSSPLRGRTVLVRAEQGIGDEILFASCLPDLVGRVGHCVIECTPRLARLFERSFPTATVHGGARDDSRWLAEAPTSDVHLMAGSLMRHFRPRLASFPAHDGYLVANPAVRDRFAVRLAALGPGLKVGISWRSMRGSRWHASYTALEKWGEILSLDGIRYVNLQYDAAGAELADASDRFGVTIHDFADLDLLGDLDGVAALISALDLVIAPANTVAHLAGALGRRLWLLNLVSSWTALGTAACPWFPSASVYLRESGMDDWRVPLARVTRDLAELAAIPVTRSDARTDCVPPRTGAQSGRRTG